MDRALDIAHRLSRTAAVKQAEEIEGILAGLLINGVRQDEIEVQHHPGRVVIAARGEPRYEVRVKFSIRDAIFGKDDN